MKKKLVDYPFLDVDSTNRNIHYTDKIRDVEGVQYCIPAPDALQRDKVDAAKDAVVTAARALGDEYIEGTGNMGKLKDAIKVLDEVRE